MKDSNFQITELEQRLEFCSCPNGSEYVGTRINHWGQTLIDCKHVTDNGWIKVTQIKAYKC